MIIGDVFLAQFPLNSDSNGNEIHYLIMLSMICFKWQNIRNVCAVGFQVVRYIRCLFFDVLPRMTGWPNG